MKQEVLNKTVEELVEFINKAEKLNKYPRNSSQSIKTALSKASGGLTTEEPRTLGYLLDHALELFGRQDLSLSPESVNVYIVRIKRAIKDFGEHGMQPGAIYNWHTNVKIQTKPREKKIAKTDEAIEQSNSDEQFSLTREENGIRLNKVQWRLRPGVMIRLELPEDLTENDVDKIKALLDIEIKFKGA